MTAAGDQFRCALVVDDHRLVRRALSGLIRRSGVSHVLTAGSVETAIANLRNNSVDLLILDVCLGKETCFPVVKAARQTNRPPFIVVISGQSDRKTVADLMADGVDAYFDKPFDIKELEKIIEAFRRGDTPFKKQIEAQVGRQGLKETQGVVRQVMCNEALSRCDGSRHAAAKLLRVDRKVIQRLFADGKVDEKVASRSTSAHKEGKSNSSEI